MTEQTRIPYKAFIAAVSRAFEIPVEQIVSHRRMRPVVHARFAAFSLLRQHRKDLGLTSIGKCFGGKDHTTVLSGIRHIERLMEDDWFRGRYLAAEKDVLSWTPDRARAVIWAKPEALSAPEPKRLPAVVSVAPARKTDLFWNDGEPIDMQEMRASAANRARAFAESLRAERAA